MTSRSVAKDSPTSAGRRLVPVNSHRITAQLVNGWLFKGLVCPACETQLPGNYVITKVDLQPSEEFTSVSDQGELNIKLFCQEPGSHRMAILSGRIM